MQSTKASALSTTDIRRHVHRRLSDAQEAAELMQLSNKSATFNEGMSTRAEMLHEIGSFNILPLGFGKKVFAGILFVDLRRSSSRAVEVGERATYLTMHGLLHGLAFVSKHFGGRIVGFRGDGLFSAFGIDDEGEQVPDSECGRAIKSAVRCGKAMIEAVDAAIVPELHQFHVDGGLQIGVGIDANHVVVTKIGLFTAHEVTAYGSAVNKAAKLADETHSKVMITRGAWEIIPGEKGGLWRLRNRPGSESHFVEFPDDYIALK